METASLRTCPLFCAPNFQCRDYVFVLILKELTSFYNIASSGLKRNLRKLRPSVEIVVLNGGNCFILEKDCKEFLLCVLEMDKYFDCRDYITLALFLEEEDGFEIKIKSCKCTHAEHLLF